MALKPGAVGGAVFSGRPPAGIATMAMSGYEVQRTSKTQIDSKNTTEHID